MLRPLTSMLLFLGSVCFCISGCGPVAVSKPKDSDEFKKLLTESTTELDGLNAAHKAWGLGNNEEWELDQDLGMIYFTVADGKKYSAKAQIIGTFDNDKQTWMWAWANPSITDALKNDSLKLKQYGQEKKIDRLTKPKWPGTAEEAQQMAALAVKLNNSKGSYRGADGSTDIYITFGDIVAMDANEAH